MSASDNNVKQMQQEWARDALREADHLDARANALASDAEEMRKRATKLREYAKRNQ